MKPEFRRDPLNHIWVAFSPERQRRPNDFGSPKLTPGKLDPFAEGNEHLTPPEVYAVRHETESNKPGWRVRVVPNRFPALRIEGKLDSYPHGPYDMVTGIGAHEVIIETPSAEIALEDLPVASVTEVLNTYRERIHDLDNDHRFQLITIFKNVGPTAGATLAHAHSQLIALPLVPPLIENKLIRAREHYLLKRRSLFADILHEEFRNGSRIVKENDHFVLFCPFASRFPFELAIYPKRHSPDYASCSAVELHALADILRFALQRLSQVLEKPGYNYILHTAPLHRPGPDGFDRYASTRTDYSWHLEIMPRFGTLAGFELGTGTYINAVFPEIAARRLRGEEEP